MKITIEATPTIVEIDDGVVARRWEGTTDTGIPVVALVNGLTPQTLDPAALAQFTAELEAVESAGKLEPTCSDETEPGLGPCCVCLGTNSVRNIIMLDRRAAIVGHGWGCVSCGLPPDGAYAVLCDDCLAKWEEDPAILTVACRGYPATEGRIPIAELPPEPFAHDEERHRADDAIFGGERR
jgi:hypothetical protein